MRQMAPQKKNENNDLPPNSFPDSNEIRFGKHLASNDKKIRDRAVAALKVWLQKRKGLTETDFLKIWKGLFYCMWMCDKVPVQMELAHRMSEMVHIFESDSLALLWFSTFARTMWREWQGLDHLRLDKYYSFMRQAVFQALEWVKRRMWSESAINQVVDILDAEIIQKVPNGLRFHLADIYLTELARSGAAEIETVAFRSFIEPFFKVLCTTPDKLFFKRTKERVFEDLLSYTPEDNKDEGMEPEDDSPTFQQVNFEAIQSWIFEGAGSEHTSERYRNQLYELHKQYQNATKIEFARSLEQLINEGIISQPMTPTSKNGQQKRSTPDRTLTASSTKKKRRKKAKEQSDEQETSVSQKENPETELPPQSEDVKTPGSKKKSKKKKKKKNSQLEISEVDENINKEVSNGDNKSPVSNNIPQTLKDQEGFDDSGTPKQKVQELEDDSVVEDGATKTPGSKKKKKKKKTKKKETQIDQESETDSIRSTLAAENEKLPLDSNRKRAKKKREKENASGQPLEVTPDKESRKQIEVALKTPEAAAKEKPEFISSKKFKGSKDGYVFKKDKNGLGYYLDRAPIKRGKKSSKKNKKKRNSSDRLSGFGSEKKVRFGDIQEKGYKASVKALKRSVVTPNKAPPSSGLLKTPVSSTKKKSVKGRKGTPFVRKTSRSFL